MPKNGTQVACGRLEVPGMGIQMVRGVVTQQKDKGRICTVKIVAFMKDRANNAWEDIIPFQVDIVNNDLILVAF